MQVGSIIRQISHPERMFLIEEERVWSWVIVGIGSKSRVVLAKSTKGFEVIA